MGPERKCWRLFLQCPTHWDPLALKHKLVGKLNISGERISHLSGPVEARRGVGQVDISEEDVEVVEAVEAGEAAWEYAEGRDRAAEKAGRTE